MRLRIKLGNLISLADSFDPASNIINQIRMVYTEKYSTNVCPFISATSEWETLHSLWISLYNNKNISHLFLYNLKYRYDVYPNSKPSSFEKYLETFEPREILIRTIKYVANNIGDMYFDKWNKIWNALTANYNPISNYNMDELEEYNTNKKTKTNTDMKTSENIDKKNATNTNVKTSSKVEQTDTNKEYTFGFNSAAKVPKVESEKHITGLPTDNYNETVGLENNNYQRETGIAQDNYKQTTGIAQDNYQQETANAEDNYKQTTGTAQDNYQQETANAEDNYTETKGLADNNYIEEVGDAEDNYRHLTKEGNIGVRSNQELVEQELELRKHKFYDIMFMDINSLLLNNVYY